MYEVWLFGYKDTTLKTFKTLKDVHAHLVNEYETKTTYKDLLKAMREYDNEPCLYQALNCICIKKV